MRSERGAALVLVFMMILLLSFLGTAALRLSRLEAKIAFSQLDQKKAFYAAQSGLAYVESTAHLLPKLLHDESRFSKDLDEGLVFEGTVECLGRRPSGESMRGSGFSMGSVEPILYRVTSMGLSSGGSRRTLMVEAFYLDIR